MKKIFNRFFALILPIIFGLIALQYTFFSVLSVRNEYKKVITSSNDSFSEINSEDTAWVRLYKEKTWLESRLKVAKSDSISLSVNLKDSVIQLELKGVVLKSTPIVNYKTSGFLNELPPDGYHLYFGKEVLTKSSLSTIEKVPLTVKKAPKDTLDYVSQSEVIDSFPNEEVHWLIKLENGIELRIEGSARDSKAKRWRNKFWIKRDIYQATTGLRKTLLFKTPAYNPVISLVITKADAKAIYRALPEKPYVNIRP